MQIRKKYRCTSYDLYGCLYFYVSEQLRLFAMNLKRLNVTIHIFNKDCMDLFKDLTSGELVKLSLPPSQRFDRIEVSNIVDDSYVGFEDVLKTWGTLLNSQNPHSTLLSYSMNWKGIQHIHPDELNRRGLLKPLLNDLRVST